MDAKAIEKLIYSESGLLGVSGISSDMRTLLASDDPRAAFAIELFCYRIARELGSLAAALGGLDALVFTGGVGERAPVVRALAADGLGFLGVVLDPARNETGPEDREIGTDGAEVRTLVVAAREDLEIVREVRRVLGSP
jgi:acetate kinase